MQIFFKNIKYREVVLRNVKPVLYITGRRRGRRAL